MVMAVCTASSRSESESRYSGFSSSSCAICSFVIASGRRTWVSLMNGSRAFAAAHRAARSVSNAARAVAPATVVSLVRMVSM